MKKLLCLILTAILLCTMLSVSVLPASADVTSANIVGSTLSEGSLAIIVGVAAAVIFGLGGFILGTKMKKKN